MWQSVRMTAGETLVAVHRTVVEALTIDAMVLADEIETYFGGEALEDALPAMDVARQGAVARVGLKAASRMNRLVEWLVRGEMPSGRPPETVVSGESLWSAEDISLLPPQARAIAEATALLFARAERMHDPAGVAQAISPARALQARLLAELGVQTE